MMKKWVVLLLALAMCLSAAGAEDAGILGLPFPDFAATDTLGNSFTLSGALEDHEAALINLWATWCPPCENEFPFLNEAYERYGDRVAFIALSVEANDTPEIIGEYRSAHGIAFPMGRDEGGALQRYTRANGIPVTVIVDRFGNAAFMRVGSFGSAEEVARVIEAFLGEGYAQTRVLNDVPKETTTRAFPVSAARALHVDNESARRIVFRAEGIPGSLTAYAINDDAARLRFEIAASDNPAAMIYYDAYQGKACQLPALLDQERGVYVYDQPMPGAAEPDHFVYGALVDADAPEDPDLIEVYLIPDDGYIEEFADLLRDGEHDISWEYEDAASAEDAPTAYTLYLIDQDGEPVPGVIVSFCTDETCTLLESDAGGLVRFDGAPDEYHLQLLKAPEGYGFDAEFEMVTGRDYGEWAVRIRRD